MHSDNYVIKDINTMRLQLAILVLCLLGLRMVGIQV